MKSVQTFRCKPDPHPSTHTRERPDNGSQSSKGSGPSSGSRKDNPHRGLKLSSHAAA
ncbi:MAG: hypothetical protein ABIP46_05365 [Polaromonas sp.]